MRALILVMLVACVAQPPPPATDAAPVDAPKSVPTRVGNYCLLVGCQTDFECQFVTGDSGATCAPDSTCQTSSPPAGETCPSDTQHLGVCVADGHWYQPCPWMV